VEFGQQELRAAITERGLTINFETELNLDQPETFHITAVSPTSIRLSGGDLRGLMYGLLEAAEQIRTAGQVSSVTSEPGLRLRAVRIAPSDSDVAAPGFYAIDRWTKVFQMLARNRINRATLVLPPERLEGDRIRVLSVLAHDYGVDFMLGIRTALGPRTLYAQLRKLLSECVLVRGVQIEVGREPIDFYRTVLFPALQESGRRVTLDLRGTDARPDVLRAAVAAGVVLEIASRSSGAALGKPFHSVVAAQSVAAELDPVRARLTILASSGSTGFEVDLAGPNVENYERVYWAWGRLGYDFRTPGMSAGKAQSKTGKKR
jgi:hypothetical protein